MSTILKYSDSAETNPMSDISSEDLYLRQKRRRKCSNSSTLLPSGVRDSNQNRRKDMMPKEKGSVHKVVDLTMDQQHISVIVQEEDRRYEVDACMDDQFQKIFKIEASDTSTRIEYKNTIVSKYVTPRELGFQGGAEVFFLMRDGKERKRCVYKIRVNFDVGEDFVVEIAEDSTIKDLLKLCKETSPLKRRLLIMNGMMLNENAVIRDVLEDGDTLDYVAK